MAGDRPTVPLVSEGETGTVRTHDLEGIGGPVAEVARAPRVSVRDAIEGARTEGFDALQSMPVRELLDVLADASLRFEGVGLAAGEPAIVLVAAPLALVGLLFAWLAWRV